MSLRDHSVAKHDCDQIISAVFMVLNSTVNDNPLSKIVKRKPLFPDLESVKFKGEPVTDQASAAVFLLSPRWNASPSRSYPQH